MGPLAVAAFGVSALSAIQGRSDAKKARKLQQEQLALQRESLAFSKQRYNEAQALYGETRQKLVDTANEGVKADLQGVTDRASADVAQSFQKSQEETDRNLARMGINPNSGRAMAARAGSGVAKAAAESGLINASRRDEKRYADDTTWNRRAFVGQMGSSEINASAGAVGNSFQSASNAYGNAASDMQQSANAGYQTAGQFAGMGLSMLSPTKAPTGSNPSRPTYMYPAGSPNGPQVNAPVDYASVINNATSVPSYLMTKPASSGVTYPNLVARR